MDVRSDVLLDWLNNLILYLGEEYVKYVLEILKVTFIYAWIIYVELHIYLLKKNLKKPTKMINAFTKEQNNLQIYKHWETHVCGAEVAGSAHFHWPAALPALGRSGFPVLKLGLGTWWTFKYTLNKFSLLDQFCTFFSINWSSEKTWAMLEQWGYEIKSSNFLGLGWPSILFLPLTPAENKSSKERRNMLQVHCIYRSYRALRSQES